jgi:hypothetical protein
MGAGMPTFVLNEPGIFALWPTSIHGLLTQRAIVFGLSAGFYFILLAFRVLE